MRTVLVITILINLSMMILTMLCDTVEYIVIILLINTLKFGLAPYMDIHGLRA